MQQKKTGGQKKIERASCSQTDEPYFRGRILTRAKQWNVYASAGRHCRPESNIPRFHRAYKYISPPPTPSEFSSTTPIAFIYIAREMSSMRDPVVRTAVISRARPPRIVRNYRYSLAARAPYYFSPRSVLSLRGLTKARAPAAGKKIISFSRARARVILLFLLAARVHICSVMCNYCCRVAALFSLFALCFICDQSRELQNEGENRRV